MHQCPKCRSSNIQRSRAKTTWENWRQSITGQRPFRCRQCNWRGWGADRGARRADHGGGVPEARNLRPIGLSRDDRRDALDLEDLDGPFASSDERT